MYYSECLVVLYRTQSNDVFFIEYILDMDMNIRYGRISCSILRDVKKMLDQFTEYFLNFKIKEIRFHITFMNFLLYKEFDYTEQLSTFLTPSSREKRSKNGVPLSRLQI